MSNIFTPEQLMPHGHWYERAWHKIRRPFGAIGWVTLQEEVTLAVAVTGPGEASGDGDTTFDARILNTPIVLHCEVDPDDLDRLRPQLQSLDTAIPVSVRGKLVVDMGHRILEIHPVRAINEMDADR